MRYVLYLIGRRPIDDYTRQYVPVFEDIHLTRSFIDVFMGNEPLIPQGDILNWGEGFKLRTSKLSEILLVEGTELPEHYSRTILHFKYGHWEKPVAPKVDDATGGNDGTIRAPSSTRERRPSVPPGYIRITELATTWGIPALHARAALRASDRVKPDFGWAFAPAEVATIKKLCGVK